jgi:hypothetical protein
MMTTHDAPLIIIEFCLSPVASFDRTGNKCIWRPALRCVNSYTFVALYPMDLPGVVSNAWKYPMSNRYAGSRSQSAAGLKRGTTRAGLVTVGGVSAWSMMATVAGEVTADVLTSL